GVPLVFGTEWYRPHTHVTALAPALTGRDIVGGTFTHASPVAAFLYRGDAGRAPIAVLAERLDGRSLFGPRIDALDAAAFATYADGVGRSVVVALEDDATHLSFRPEPRSLRRAAPPFLVFTALEPPLALHRRGSEWTVSLADGDAWRSTGLAFSPLWRVSSG